MTEEKDEHGVTTYKMDELENPLTVKSDHLITSIKVTPTQGDDRVVVYNRGANAGHIFLRKGDGAAFARLLLEGK